MNVPRLVFLDSAKLDLSDIAERIERESANREVAEAFVDKLIAHCSRLASLPHYMGRARHDLGTPYRSITFGNYVIFLLYENEGKGPLDVVKVVHVLWGARDLEAFFDERPAETE